VLLPERIPANDAGIAVGQVIEFAHRAATEKERS
jgi:hydrogenase maturation factor HypF (carbamoyltransferase family)